jgi:hypothetical protein
VTCAIRACQHCFVFQAPWAPQGTPQYITFLADIRRDINPVGAAFKEAVDGLFGSLAAGSRIARLVHTRRQEAGIGRHREPLRKLATASLAVYVDRQRSMRDALLTAEGFSLEYAMTHPEVLAGDVMPVETTDKKRSKTLEKRWFAGKFLEYNGPLNQNELSATQAYCLLLALWKHDPERIRIPSDAYLFGTHAAGGDASD